jgi:hypothetical protein
VDVELVPEASAAEEEAVGRAIDLTAQTRSTTPPWRRAGLVEAVERAPSDGPRASGYEAVRSPRSTLGATRA